MKGQFPMSEQVKSARAQSLRLSSAEYTCSCDLSTPSIHTSFSQHLPNSGQGLLFRQLGWLRCEAQAVAADADGTTGHNDDMMA